MNLADSRTDDEPEQSGRNLLQARRVKSKRGFDIHAAVGVTASDRDAESDSCATAPGHH